MRHDEEKLDREERKGKEGFSSEESYDKKKTCKKKTRIEGYIIRRDMNSLMIIKENGGDFNKVVAGR